MALSTYLNQWQNFLRVAQLQAGRATLTSRHIYILPTRYGWLYGLVLIAMLAGSINYTLSLGFVLTFLLAGLGNVAMLHTWRNLAYLHVENAQVQPVFAGQNAKFNLTLIETSQRQRYAIAAQFEGMPLSYIDILANSHTAINIALHSQQRGWLKAPRVRLHTEFPFGLFHVWAYAQLDMQCLVYPHPSIASTPLPYAASDGEQGQHEHVQGDDDFAGHRAYQFGDSPRRIDWKASSREQGMLTKLFEGQAQRAIWLDWAYTQGKDGEKRISQLTRWVLDAHAKQLSYGLRLPNIEIAPNQGEAHYLQCLKTLALVEI